LLFITNACPKDVCMAPKAKRVTKPVINKNLRFLADKDEIGLCPKLRINLSLGRLYCFDYFIIPFFLVH
jgi:hypothetical protein